MPTTARAHVPAPSMRVAVKVGGLTPRQIALQAILKRLDQHWRACPECQRYNCECAEWDRLRAAYVKVRNGEL